MGQVFRNLKPSLAEDARLVIVVLDRSRLYHDLLQKLGFHLEAELQRQVERRTGRRAQPFFESVLVWKLS